VIQESFQELYSAKTDEELLALAADSVSLREDAKSVLAQELQRRNLEQPPSQQAGHQLGGEAESRAIPRALKAGAFLSMNVIIAVFAPAAIDVSVRNGIPLYSTSALVWEEYLISLICASGLGFGACPKVAQPPDDMDMGCPGSMVRIWILGGRRARTIFWPSICAAFGKCSLRRQYSHVFPHVLRLYSSTHPWLLLFLRRLPLCAAHVPAICRDSHRTCGSIEGQ